MGFFGGFKKVASQIIDIRVDRWANLKDNKDTAVYFINLARRLLKPAPPGKLEDFETVVEEQALSDAALAEKSEDYKALAMLFVFVAGLLLIYTFVLICLGNFMGTCISAALVIYALSQAFRFHFWHFQISQRKLGCSLSEWCRFVSGSKRTSNV
ncbi:MAG: type IVB secretion system protein IcmV [Gammaproteobacteria bacterium]|nr:type IVB secretion system protein IcmV [Gammaproteobacteria bacterium]MBP9729030.1 type IVB secretion system protein IcmV [Gammaproteobacteria bacterium]